MPVVAKSIALNRDVEMRLIRRAEGYVYQERWFRVHRAERPVSGLRDGLSVMHAAFKARVDEGREMLAIPGYRHYVTDIACSLPNVISF